MGRSSEPRHWDSNPLTCSGEEDLTESPNGRLKSPFTSFHQFLKINSLLLIRTHEPSLDSSPHYPACDPSILHSSSTVSRPLLLEAAALAALVDQAPAMPANSPPRRERSTSRPLATGLPGGGWSRFGGLAHSAGLGGTDSVENAPQNVCGGRNGVPAFFGGLCCS